MYWSPPEQNEIIINLHFPEILRLLHLCCDLWQLRVEQVEVESLSSLVKGHRDDLLVTSSSPEPGLGEGGGPRQAGHQGQPGPAQYQHQQHLKS